MVFLNQTLNIKPLSGKEMETYKLSKNSAAGYPHLLTQLHILGEIQKGNRFPELRRISRVLCRFLARKQLICAGILEKTSIRIYKLL